MAQIFSFLIFVVLYSLQIYFTRKKCWIVAILLPVSVIVVMLTKRFLFDSYNLLFIDSDSGGLFAYCFLGGALGTLIMGLKRNKESKL